MNSKYIEEYFDRILPRSLSCEWDNDGLMICSEPGKDIKKAMITLDLTKDALDHAINIGADAVFTHHPFIFKPIYSISVYDKKADLIMEAIKSGISVFSYHTRLDAVSGGVNDILCSMLGLSDVELLGDGDYSIARMGSVSNVDITSFAKSAKEALGAPIITLARSKNRDKIGKVAVLGGAADKDIVRYAVSKGADMFVCGEYSYNSVLDANIEGIDIMLLGHYYSENPILTFFEKHLKELNIDTDIYTCGYFDVI